MELDERRSGVRWRKRRRCPGTKRVSGQSRLTLRCHNATYIREREKERKRRRQSEKYQTTNITKYIKLKVRMHENA